MLAKPSEVCFGWIAAQKEFVAPEQVVRSLSKQANEKVFKGKHERIRHIVDPLLRKPNSSAWGSSMPVMVRDIWFL